MTWSRSISSHSIVLNSTYDGLISVKVCPKILSEWPPFLYLQGKKRPEIGRFSWLQPSGFNAKCKNQISKNTESPHLDSLGIYFWRLSPRVSEGFFRDVYITGQAQERNSITQGNESIHVSAKTASGSLCEFVSVGCTCGSWNFQSSLRLLIYIFKSYFLC